MDRKLQQAESDPQHPSGGSIPNVEFEEFDQVSPSNIHFDLKEIVCPVCGSDQFRQVGWHGGASHHAGAGLRSRIVRCLECSHLYPNPMPFPQGGLSALYQAGDEYFTGHDPAAKKRLGLKMFAEFESRLGRHGKYLDVGCGRGEYLSAGREAGWECTGVDPSAEFLEWGKTNLGVEGLLGTLEDLQLPAESVDAVTLESVIEHLYDPYATLKEVWRVLQPGGILWFDAPNEDGLYMRVGNLYMKAQGRDWIVNLAPTFPPYHVQGFNPRSIRRLLHRSGFHIQQLDVVGGVVAQTGSCSIRKRIEYTAAHVVNWIGRQFNAGTYMSVWAVKQ